MGEYKLMCVRAGLERMFQYIPGAKGPKIQEK